jgi:hypothetical protein
MSNRLRDGRVLSHRTRRQHVPRQACWFLDADTVWLRPCPPPSASGHIFGAMQAAANSLPFPGDWQRYWRVKWLRQPCCQEWLSVPFRFPCGSVVLEAAVDATRKVLSGTLQPDKVKYLYFMSTVKAALQTEADAPNKTGCSAGVALAELRSCVFPLPTNRLEFAKNGGNFLFLLVHLCLGWLRLRTCVLYVRYLASASYSASASFRASSIGVLYLGILSSKPFAP